jgi:hypothetical protein
MLVIAKFSDDWPVNFLMIALCNIMHGWRYTELFHVGERPATQADQDIRGG